VTTLQRSLTTVLSVLTLLGLATTALATDLPQGLVDYLVRKDRKVQVRFDGMVTFSNGRTYLPVLPQDPTGKANPDKVTVQLPKPADYPDIIGFDNNLYLLRMAELAPGKFSLPQLLEYPLTLKEGLLPQDLLLPPNLYIPSELRVILGALPYNYDPSAAVNDAAKAMTPPVGLPAATTKPAATKNVTVNFKTNTANKPVETVPQSPLANEHLQQFTFPGLAALPGVLTGDVLLADLKGQSLVRLTPETGKFQTPIALHCIPSSLALSPDGQKAYATCLTTDELVVVNLTSNLVQARVKVGSRPDSVLPLPAATVTSMEPEDLSTASKKPALQSLANKVLVSNRFSDVLSVIDATTLTSLNDIKLPAPGGRMVYSAANNTVFVADANTDAIYEVDVLSGTLKRTLKGLAGTSAMWLNTQVMGESQGHQQLWLTSRGKGQVLILDLVTGTPIKTLVVGDKPTAMAAFGDNLYVVSSDENRIDVINWHTGAAQDPIPLENQSFPNGIRIAADGKTAYVSAIGSEELYVIDLASRKVLKRMALGMRTVDMAVAGSSTTTPTVAPKPVATTVIKP
jgi:DNA-binding beta-propeller fold protein YncE